MGAVCLSVSMPLWFFWSVLACYNGFLRCLVGLNRWTGALEKFGGASLRGRVLVYDYLIECTRWYIFCFLFLFECTSWYVSTRWYIFYLYVCWLSVWFFVSVLVFTMFLKVVPHGSNRWSVAVEKIRVYPCVVVWCYW